ncbi:MAG TPA: hypothetical protein V6C76_03050 [Drouetiella sp.]
MESESNKSVEKFKAEPTVVTTLDGDIAIIQADGSCASRVDGQWQPGIAFDSQDFVQMAKVGDKNKVQELLKAAAESLAKSLDQPSH